MVGDLEDKGVASIVTSSSASGIIPKHLLSSANSFSSSNFCLLASLCSRLLAGLLELPSSAFSLPSTALSLPFTNSHESLKRNNGVNGNSGVMREGVDVEVENKGVDEEGGDVEVENGFACSDSETLDLELMFRFDVNMLKKTMVI
nr:hypothetical protein [Tanacetum cinerariifolium]